MQTKRVTALAFERVSRLVELFDYVAADGTITREERRLVVVSARDAVATTRAADAADALARGIGRATSARQIGDLTRSYQAAIDELPDRLPAA